MDKEKKGEGKVGETKEGGEALSGLGLDTGKEISTVFNQHGVGFVLLPAGQKKPPDRNEWQKKENQYSFQEIDGYRGARNIGLVASFGYVILDVDDPSALNGLELPKSTKWETRTNAERYAIWFKCEDSRSALSKRKGHTDKGKLELFDSHQLVEVEDKKGEKTAQYAPIGKVRLRRTYEVIPPSWKRIEENGNRVDYSFLDGGEIAPHTISLEWLISSLDKLGIVFSSKPDKRDKKASVGTIASPSLEKGKKKNETPTNKPLTANINTTNSRELNPIDIELEGAKLGKLGNTHQGDPKERLEKSAHSLGYIGTNYNHARDDVLIPFGRSLGLDPEEIKEIIKKGYFAGTDRSMEEERKEAERRGTVEFDPSMFIENRKVIPKRVADDILGKFTIRTRGGDHQIFFYDNGIYIPKGKDPIIKEVEKLLGELSGNHINDEVIGHIQRTTLTDPSEFNSQKNLIHLENGIFDLNQMELREFNKEIISTTKLPITYVEDGDCPKFREFLGQILTHGDASLIQEVFGWCLIKDYRFQTAVMCVGDGSNGKSTLLDVLEEFLGRDNIANIPLQQLSMRFKLAHLFGKIANIYSDLPAAAFRETGVFKIVTGGDQIEGERKYSQEPVKFVNYAKMIFSANKIPETSDESDAFFRRWILINFPNKFEGDEADTDLHEKITTAEELSGIFNWALIGLRRLLDRGGFEYIETAKVSEQYRRMSSSLLAFVEDCVEEVAGGEEWVSKEEFYNAYIGYCKAEGLPTKAKNVVGRELAEHVNVQGSTKRTHQGQVRVWKGIRLLLPDGEVGDGNRLVTDW